MSIKLLATGLCALMLLAGCTQLDDLLYGTATPPAAPAPDAGGTAADAIYINARAQASGAALRSVYIAPANLANMQVIQPEGASADSEWWVTEDENRILQSTISQAFAVALAYQSAFNVVYDPAQADIVLNTALIAVHPSETRGSVARREHPGGALTVSIALVNARSEAVMLRMVDTRASDDIWAFNQVKQDDAALSAMFRALGDGVRRALLQAQGRPSA